MDIRQELQTEESVVVHQPNVVEHTGAVSSANEGNTLTYTDPLVEELNRVTLRRKRFYNIAYISSLAILPVALMMVMGAGLNIPALAALPFFLFLMLVITMFAFVWTGSTASKRAAEAVRNTEDLTAVGPLCQALELADPKYRPALVIASDLPAYMKAVPTLKRLLPRLTSDDLGILNLHQQECLNRALKFSADPRQKRFYDLDFTISILQALNEVGGSSSLPYIKPLETLKVDGEKAELVRELARSASARILARAEDAIQASRLLRPSDAQGVQDTALLRAVQATSTATDSLLKPSDSPIDSGG